MIRILNKYYRTRDLDSCDFDVLDMVGFEASEKVEFKRKKYEDINAVGKIDFIYAVGLYVSALKTEIDNGFERKAIVKGD